MSSGNSVTTSATIADPKRFERAMARIDAANSEDPHQEIHDDVEYPKELLYSQRMSAWLEALKPDASEALRLAARAQHIRRWNIPRSEYPMDRAGYKRWRTTLAKFHADTTGQILRDVGYDTEFSERVQSLIRKERFKTDPEAQTLEDVICLVFLENHFADFARRHDEEKLIGVLRKTWKKMSPQGHQAALALNLPADARALVEKALAA